MKIEYLTGKCSILDPEDGPRKGDAVLTIRQPFAWMVIRGFKPIENRSKPFSHRGKLWIHAAKTVPKDGWPEELVTVYGMDDADIPDSLDYGEIIGCVDVVDVFDVDNIPPFWTGNVHAQGQYCMVLTNPAELVNPIPYSGQLGIFRFK